MPEPAGWHADPTRRHEMRYWDGAQWTEHVSDQGSVSADPHRGTDAPGAGQPAPTEVGTSSDGTLLVGARSVAFQVPSLSMKCDEREIPDPLSGVKPVGWWAGYCRFGGAARPGGETGVLGEPQDGQVEGIGALAVCEGRVIGIIGPQSPSSPALWWSWSQSSVKVEAMGRMGALKWRPEAIRLDRNGGVDADGDSVRIEVVRRLYRRSGRYQKAEEASLLKALN